MIDDDQTLARRRDDAALAEQNLLHIRCVGDAEKNDIGMPRRFGGGFDRRRAALHERVRFRARPREEGHRMTRSQKMARHGSTHDAEADERKGRESL